MANWYRAATWNCSNTSDIPNTIGEWIAYFASLASDPNFPWETASSSNAGATNYLVFRPKGGGVGRGIILGGSTAFHGSAAAPGVFFGTNFIFFGWSPTSTVNTPADYTTTTPFAYPDFSGVQVFSTASGNRFTLYAKDGQLVFHMANLNSQHSFAVIGPIFANRDNTVFYQGLASTGFYHTTLSQWNGIGCTPSNSTGSNISNSSDARCLAATGVWHRLARAVSLSEYTSSNPIGAMLVDSSNRATFYPLLSCSLHDNTTNKVFVKMRNMAVSTHKVFLHQWLDNASAPKGYYLGYHTTLASDAAMLSLTNDDM
jgi:hypothetical protein